MSLDEEAGMLQEALSTVQRLRVRIEELEILVEGEIHHREFAERERDAGVAEIQAMRQRMVDLRAELGGEEAAKRTLQIRLDRVEIDLKSRSAEVKELSGKLAVAQASGGKKEEMQRQLNSLLEQQLQDGDELVRQLRQQLGECTAEVAVMRRALLKAGEVNSKLEAGIREMSKKLADAQDMVRGTRRLKEEGPIRMREYVKNVLESMFQDALAMGGTQAFDQWNDQRDGQKSYDQMRRENFDLIKRMRNVERIFKDLADENARLAVQLDRCASMVETGQQRSREQLSELGRALEDKAVRMGDAEARCVELEREAQVLWERARAKSSEDRTLMECMTALHNQVSAGRMALASEGRDAEAAVAQLRSDEHALHRMIEDAEASIHAVVRELHRHKGALESLSVQTKHALGRGGGRWEQAVEKLEAHFQDFEAGLRARVGEETRGDMVRLQSKLELEGRPTRDRAEASKRLVDLIQSMAGEGKRGSAKSKVPGSGARPDASRPVSVPASRGVSPTSPARGAVRVSQHMAPSSAGYSILKDRQSARGEAKRVLKSAQSLLDRTYTNNSGSALSHSQL